jgi:transglutaminase-like putative cysteine protease
MGMLIAECGSLLPSTTAQPPQAETASSRTFELRMQTRIAQPQPGAKYRIWIPLPSNSDDQTIKILSARLPAASEQQTEDRLENRMLYCEWTGDDRATLEFGLDLLVQRREVRASLIIDQPSPLESQRQALLKPDRLVPVNSPRLLAILGDQKMMGNSLEQARKIYDAVERHMQYDKSKPGYGNGDALWACDSKTGNCTDFHSVFISLARSQGIPALFEIGFPLPPEHGSGTISGYHCWAKFYVAGRGWLPVDISEADKNPELKEYYFGNLTENRVAVSRGRDLILSPPQQGAPLNYFVYPYVEVNGQPLDPSNIKWQYEFVDQLAEPATGQGAAAKQERSQTPAR